MNNKFFEWTGVVTAILYSLFVALNIGIEFLGFCLLLLSAILIGIWAYRGGHKGILVLQFKLKPAYHSYYTSSCIKKLQYKYSFMATSISPDTN